MPGRTRPATRRRRARGTRRCPAHDRDELGHDRAQVGAEREVVVTEVGLQRVSDDVADRATGRPRVVQQQRHETRRGGDARDDRCRRRRPHGDVASQPAERERGNEQRCRHPDEEDLRREPSPEQKRGEGERAASTGLQPRGQREHHGEGNREQRERPVRPARLHHTNGGAVAVSTTATAAVASPNHFRARIQSTTSVMAPTSSCDRRSVATETPATSNASAVTHVDVAPMWGSIHQRPFATRDGHDAERARGQAEDELHRRYGVECLVVLQAGQIDLAQAHGEVAAHCRDERQQAGDVSYEHRITDARPRRTFHAAAWRRAALSSMRAVEAAGRGPRAAARRCARTPSATSAPMLSCPLTWWASERRRVHLSGK